MHKSRHGQFYILCLLAINKTQSRLSMLPWPGLKPCTSLKLDKRKKFHLLFKATLGHTSERVDTFPRNVYKQVSEDLDIDQRPYTCTVISMRSPTEAAATFPRNDSCTSAVLSEAPSFSTLGPSPSERFLALALKSSTSISPAADAAIPRNDAGSICFCEPHFRISDAQLAAVKAGVALGEIDSVVFGDRSYNEKDFEDDMSVLTISRTITKLSDLPDDKIEAIGTVLEEETPTPVPLVVEFLASGRGTNDSAWTLCNELQSADLELSVECQFLPKVDLFSNSDPFAEMWRSKPVSGGWDRLGRTETITNAHFPRFVTKFTIPVRPDDDLEDEIKVKVRARGYFNSAVLLGTVTCSVWDIIAAPGHCKVLNLDETPDEKKNSYVVISGDVCRSRMHDLAPRKVQLHVLLDETARPRSKTHFIVSRGMRKGRWVPIYRSEGFSSPDCEYAPVELTFADTFCGQEDKLARIEFYQRRAGVDPKLCGFLQFSVRQVEKMEEGMAFHWWNGQDVTPPGRVKLTKKIINSSEVRLWLSVTNE